MQRIKEDLYYYYNAQIFANNLKSWMKAGDLDRSRKEKRNIFYMIVKFETNPYTPALANSYPK